MKQWCTNYKFSQNEFASRYSTQLSYIYTRHVFFAHLSFQTHDPTQPTKNTNFRPIPDTTQPNPTEPAGQRNPWTTLSWYRASRDQMRCRFWVLWLSVVQLWACESVIVIDLQMWTKSAAARAIRLRSNWKLLLTATVVKFMASFAGHTVGLLYYCR